jgi:uroporphyrinogen-III decarboxylase
MDFTAHNREQAEVWQAYHAGHPTRVPMTISANERMILLDPALNPTGISFKDCYDDPDVMFEVMLRFQHWFRMNMPGDFERGLPEAWNIGVGFQNYYDAAWFGAEIKFLDHAVPDTAPLLTDDNKNLLFDRGIPDPFGGLMARGQAYVEHFKKRTATETYEGLPINVGGFWAPFGGDGPFTVACNLRGATEFCLDLYEDPDYAQQLMAFIVEATLARQKAWLEATGQSLERKGLGLADDSIALLSCDAYKELVLPHHKRLLSAMRAPDATVGIHLCGDSTRHFKTIVDELGANSFDTGFPVDFGWLRREVGPDVAIQGGVHVDILLHGTPETVATETRRILRTGVTEGGKFIMKEANNLAPCTPMANLEAMYAVCREEGVYATV